MTDQPAIDTAGRENAVSVAVCIATYLRPVGLTRLLESLQGLRFTKNNGVTVQVVVVDNDPGASARAVVEDAQADRWPVLYDVEPRRGIPFARNRAVAIASGCAYIAFVDDDESADPTWLDELLAARRQLDAGIVAGPVAPAFEPGVPRWMREGGFFEKRRGVTGTTLDWASTANILMRSDLLEDVPGPFDGRLALSGGSDFYLTTYLARSGARIVWCDEAVVRESIPASRATTRWILQRAYRRGNTQSICERALPPSMQRSLDSLWKDGAKRILRGAAGILRGPLSGRAAVVRRLAEIASGLGLLMGLVGHRYEEYRKVHGT